MTKAKLTYKDAGVDIDKADGFVKTIGDYSKDTHTNEVLQGIGGFAGLFAPNLKNLKEPVLVAATDGIGTKLSLGIECENIANLGQDLVAMCVNDLICAGATPLFFLDYFATGKLNTDQLEALIKSISQSLKSIHCALLGGETAEMPGLYKNNDFDMAGFSVGIVDRHKILDGPKNLKPGDMVLGLKSSGLHSNGFSLVRKILSTQNINLKKTFSFAQDGLDKALLAPTKLYVNPILKLLENFSIGALAHITGGGLIENLPRVLPKSLQANIKKENILVPELFRFLQDEGGVEESEMWRVFNMGVGFVIIVSENDQKEIINFLENQNETVFTLGKLQTKANQNDDSVVFV